MPIPSSSQYFINSIIQRSWNVNMNTTVTVSYRFDKTKTQGGLPSSVSASSDIISTDVINSITTAMKLWSAVAKVQWTDGDPNLPGYKEVHLRYRKALLGR